MRGLEPAVPKLTVIPYLFRGQDAPEVLKQINSIVDSRYGGNSNLKVLALSGKDKNQFITGSNSLILPVANEVLAPAGYRTIHPEELERTIQEGDTIRIKGNHYVDLGLVLDFSGKNHELAEELFGKLPKNLRDLDRLPAVMIGYGLANSETGDYGVIPVYKDGTVLRTEKILSEPSGQFDANDPELLKSGFPSRLGDGKRRLYTKSQTQSSFDNLGLSRLYLGRGLNLVSNVGSLSVSVASGRVASVSAEGTH